MVFLEYMFCIYLNGKIVVAIDQVLGLFKILAFNAVILLILEVFPMDYKLVCSIRVSANVIKIMKMKYLNSKNCGITKCKFQ